MANEEHLKILRQGVHAWNLWRERNPAIMPDLRGWRSTEDYITKKEFTVDPVLTRVRSVTYRTARAHSGGLDLSNMNLRETNLSGADLTRANLSRANLSRANLSGANLSGADLRGANLFRADLNGTDLNGADLRGADLRGAVFHGTYLSGATLSWAVVGWSTFGNVDLSVVTQLDSVLHHGPSFVDIHTIYRSKGNIPHSFLQGAGIPDTFIDYIGSLVGQSTQYYSCFISYSSRDQAFAERLHADLQDKGVRCWFALEDMKIGDRIRPTLDASIQVHDKLLLVLSKHSVESDWVEQEVETALARERQEKRTVLFPVRLDDSAMEIEVGWPALIRNTRHIGDFRHWKDHDAYQQAFGRLLRDLKAWNSGQLDA